MNLADFKLGCRPSAPDPRTLMLGRYLASPRLEPPPDEVDYTDKVSLPWGDMRNKTVGCCVLAGGGHTQMVWTANRGHLFIPSDQAIIDAYSDITGYDPKQTDANGYNPTDQGTDPLDGLKYRHKTGIAGRKIGAYGAINAQDMQRIKQVVNLFESAELALALPNAAAGQEDWDIPPGQELVDEWTPWSWGGHYIVSPKYDREWCYLITWGMVKRASWRWILAYAVGAYGVLSEDMLDLTTGLAPSGVDITALTEDLEAITA